MKCGYGHASHEGCPLWREALCVCADEYFATGTVTLADLQVEAVRGVVRELLTSSGSASPAVWAPMLLGQLSRILDASEPLDVMGILADQQDDKQ